MHVSISVTTSLVTSFIQVKLMAHREYHIEISLFSKDKIDALNTIVFISENYPSYKLLIGIIWKPKQILRTWVVSYSLYVCICRNFSRK